MTSLERLLNSWKSLVEEAVSNFLNVYSNGTIINMMQ